MLHRNISADDGQLWPDAPTAPCRRSDARQPLPDADALGVFEQIIGGLSEQAALIGDDWTVLAVNEAWAQMAALTGRSNFTPGASYYQEVARLAQTDHPAASAVLGALDEIEQGKRKSFRLVYEGAGELANRQFEARLTVIGFGGRTYLMVTRYDVTELVQLRGLRDDFKLSLLKTQEDERRRMGRELHDSGLQMLACFGLALAKLKRAELQPERETVMAEMEELLLMARREFRAISYLAHPPQLESLSLEDALSMLIEGFAQRSGLEVDFALEGGLDALDLSAEHAVYRVVQEAISNVHRHAAARKLVVRVVERDRMLHVVVSDDGRGVPEGIRYGVGLDGMQARLKELGGRLTLFRRPPGTTVLASLPLARQVREPGGRSVPPRS